MSDDYFDPNDWENQEALEVAKKSKKAMEHLYKQEMLENQQKTMNQLWEEALTEEGMDHQSYQNLAGHDPEHVKGLMKEGMKGLVAGVKTGRTRDTRGRFTSGDQAPRKNIPHEETKTKANVMERMRAKAEKTHLDDDDLMSVIDALFPGGL